MVYSRLILDLKYLASSQKLMLGNPSNLKRHPIGGIIDA